MCTTITKETTAWFNNLPTEIIFMIFDYLSKNDIVYAFFFVNQRFNNLLLQNPQYLKLNLPTTNLNTWKRIFSVIRFEIESLNITSIDLSFPLSYFPNLKSLIISSPYGFPDEQLKQILEDQSLTKLDTFKIKEKKIDPGRLNYCHLMNRNDVLKNVFTHKSSLRTFHFSLNGRVSPDYLINLEINSNLCSLTLFLNKFQDIFTIISYAPNLEYLNVHCPMPDKGLVSIKNTNMKLKQFHLTLDHDSIFVKFDDLINNIKYFSPSLIRLSLNLIKIDDINDYEFPFNSMKLRQLLESMIELTHFHLYARLYKPLKYNDDISSEFYEPFKNHDSILSRFQDEYWFDHQWFFGMHGQYLYTLPFYFDYLHEFYEEFQDVKTSNPEILKSNPKIWYNVKSIDLCHALFNNLYYLEELKIKMPKLNCIKLNTLSDFRSLPYRNGSEENGVTKTVTRRFRGRYMRETLINDTFACPHSHSDTLRGSVVSRTKTISENGKEWLNNALPNLYHLIISTKDLSTKINSPLFNLLNKKVQRLDIHIHCLPLPELSETIYIYFPNVQYIYFILNDESFEKCEPIVGVVQETLEKSKNIHTLIISHSKSPFPTVVDTNKRIGDLLLKNIMKDYETKSNHDWILLSKVE